jgi:predicted transcriptional regulator
MAKTQSTKGLRTPGLNALAYIASHPGCCTAEVDRACRTARGGHKWMYEVVGRLIRRGLVRTVANGARADLFAVDVR